MTNKLREKREAVGLSQTRLGFLAGLSNSCISEFERESRRPWPRARRAIAQALGCTEAEIFPEQVAAGDE